MPWCVSGRHPASEGYVTFMKDIEKLELLKAALAVAAADHELKAAERGVVMGLAARVGVGRASLERMIDAARNDPHFADEIVMTSERSARTAMELLVAEARIDGEISEAERELLVRLAGRLKLSPEDFQEIYKAGLARADRVRRRHL